MKYSTILAVAALAMSTNAFAQHTSRFSTPVYSYESTTNYSTSRDHYNQFRSDHLRDLNAGRNFNNPANGPHNATNDVAIAWPPNRAPIIIACYLHSSTVALAARNAAHAEIARIVAEEWG